MATCPQCGYEESTPSEGWVASFKTNEETTFPISGLVVCPECDSVLGGIEK